ncbi:MAG: hypothetical protein ACLQVD_12815 [Capsulimonadaceae bacterium]
MGHLIEHLLKDAYDKAILYHVNPKIFVALYLTHWVLLWSAVAWTVVVYRRGRDVSTLISLDVLILISPWFYPLFFGKLPTWADAGLVVAMIGIAWHGYHKIRKRLAGETIQSISPTPQVKVEESV